MTSTAARLTTVDLNLLVALDVLLAERSVTAAGERLALTQSAMSGALARLRRLFEDDLLVRVGRTMRPTPFAESLQAPLRDILVEVERTVFMRPAFDPSVAQRSFDVIATDYIAVLLLRPLLAVLEQEAPQVQVQIHQSLLLAPDDHLMRGDADLAVVSDTLTSAAGLERQRLFEERFVVAVWRGNQEVGERLSVDQLRQLPYLSFRAGAGRTVVDVALEAIGEARTPDTTLESFFLGAFLLQGTRHFTFLQERLVRQLGDAADVRSAESPVRLPRLVEVMAWHPRMTNDPGHQWLRERIAALVDELRLTGT